MNQKSIITSAENREFLIRIYFGDLKQPLENCIHRAYLDFCRTIHGLSSFTSNKKIYASAAKALNSSLMKLKNNDNLMDQQNFDNWHRDSCVRLCKDFDQNSFPYFYIGQAQKWINMTLKYIFVLGDECIPGFNDLYLFCHIPLDRIVIGELKKLKDSGLPKINWEWSQLKNYDDYLKIQKWVRDNSFLIPLDLEFKIWLNPDDGLKKYLK